MSAADKQKLDGIEAGGGDMTGEEILAALAPVDGHNSGLDADLLDGHHSDDFSAVGHTHSYVPLAGGTMTGNLNFTGGAFVRTYGDSSSYYANYGTYQNNSYIYSAGGSVVIDSVCRARVDNDKSLGLSSIRWSHVYTASLMLAAGLDRYEPGASADMAGMKAALQKIKGTIRASKPNRAPGVIIGGDLMAAPVSDPGGAQDLRLELSGIPEVAGIKLADNRGNLKIESVLALLVEIVKELVGV
jgi:hypothetical protein